MDLHEIMQFQNFALLGDTLNEEKYAYKIKHEMTEHGYTVFSVGKELASLNDIEEDIDVVDVCIHPKKALQLLKECKKSFRMIVLQPGAFDDALLEYLKEQNLPYIEGCLLVGLRLYAKDK